MPIEKYSPKNENQIKCYSTFEGEMIKETLILIRYLSPLPPIKINPTKRISKLIKRLYY